jgi:hypothetical protein
MKKGHIQKLKVWSEKYGDVIRITLGEREVVSVVWKPRAIHVAG